MTFTLLTDEQKEVALRRWHEGLSVGEIADGIGCDPADIRALVMDTSSYREVSHGWDNGAYVINGEFRVQLPEGEPGRLLAWWLNTALDDHNKTVPKTAEYGGVNDGSADLRVMGYALAELCGMHDEDEAVKYELAVWFYALGKISRLISDYKHGKQGKPDTWFDLVVYGMMARRIQEVGRWP